MFALEEAFNSAYRLIYSQLTPFECMHRSFTNAIFTHSSAAEAISFMECIADEGELQFIVVNVLVAHEGGLPAVRSNIRAVEVPGLAQLQADEVEIMKIELARSPHSPQEYLLFLKIEMKDKSRVYLVAGFFYDLEELLEGGGITIATHQVFHDRLCKAEWLPPFGPTEEPRFVTVSKDQLRYFQLLENSYESREILAYDLFTEKKTEIVESAFFSVHRPFYQHVLVLLQKNGHLYFGIPAATEFLPESSSFKAFYSCYSHYSSSSGEEGGFRLLKREDSHIREKQRAYIGLRIIDLEKRLPGLSILALFSSKESLNEYHIDLFFLSLTRTAFVLTPIASLLKNSQKACEFVLENQGDRLYLRFSKQIWVLDLEGFIQLHMHGKPSREEVIAAIKLEKIMQIPDLRPMRIAVIAEGHLFLLRLKQGKVLFEIHEIGPFPEAKKEEDITLLMLRIKSELQKLEELQQANSVQQIAIKHEPLENTQTEHLEKYNTYVTNLIAKLQKMLSEQCSFLHKKSEEIIKLSEKFTLKVKAKMQRLGVLKQRVDQNTLALNGLATERLFEIEEMADEWEGNGEKKHDILMEKLKHIASQEVELEQQDRRTYTASTRSQKNRLKKLSKVISGLSSKLDSILSRQAGEPEPSD